MTRHVKDGLYTHRHMRARTHTHTIKSMIPCQPHAAPCVQTTWACEHRCAHNTALDSQQWRASIRVHRPHASRVRQPCLELSAHLTLCTLQSRCLARTHNTHTDTQRNTHTGTHLDRVCESASKLPSQPLLLRLCDKYILVQPRDTRVCLCENHLYQVDCGGEEGPLFVHGT